MLRVPVTFGQVIRESEIRSADGLGLYAWLRDSRTRPKGVVAHVHGIGEHSRRYDHLTAYWQERGYASAGFDLRGHGRSAGRRGHTPSYGALMDDIATFLDFVAEAYADVPTTLYGHSMGGNLVLNYALRRQPLLAAVIASSPYLRLTFEPARWMRRGAALLARIAPSISVRTRIDMHDLSRDPEVVRRCEADPLVHERITLSFFTQAHAAAEAAIRRASEISVPVLVMHGRADRITSPAGSEAFVAASSGRAELKLWDGCFHELHNEPGWREIAAFVLAWIEAEA